MLKNTFATAMFKGLGALFTMAVIYIAGRITSSEGLGAYFYYFSFIVILSCLMRFGLDICLVQRNQCGSEISEIYTVAIAYSTFVAVACCLIIFLIYGLKLGHGNILIWVLVVLSAYFWSLIDLICSLDWLRQKHIKSSLLKYSIFPVIQLILYLSLVIIDVGVNELVALLATLASSLLIACGLVVIVVEDSIKNIVRVSGERIYNTIRSSSAIFAENILTIVTVNLPVLFLGGFVSAEANAVYGVARRLSNIMGFLSTSAVRVITPVFANYNNQSGNDEIIDKKQKVENVLSMIMLGAIFISVVFGQAMLNAFGLAEGRWILTLLLISHLFSMRVATNTAFFQVMRKPLLGMNIAILNCIGSALLLWLLSVSAGLYGVVVAILIVSIILAYVSNVMIVRVYKD